MQKKQSVPTKNKLLLFYENNLLLKSLWVSYIFAVITMVCHSLFMLFLPGQKSYHFFEVFQTTLKNTFFFFIITTVFYALWDKSLCSQQKARLKHLPKIPRIKEKVIIIILVFGIPFYWWGLYLTGERVFTNCHMATVFNICYDDIPCPLIEEFFSCNEGTVNISFTKYVVSTEDDNKKLFTKVGSVWYLKPEFYSKKEIWQDRSVHYYIYER